jgi:poly-gamma-glutamate synthesis protein (capsule biosynthesis protein)
MMPINDRNRKLALASLAALLVGTTMWWPSAPVRGQMPPRDWSKDMQMKIAEPFSLASVGDILMTKPFSAMADAGVQSALKVVRDADLAMGNFESNIRDERHYTGLVTQFTGTKDVAPDVKAMGFDMVARANNHAFDGGRAGFFETANLLEAAGVAVAGAGRDLDEARAARFLEVPKGRIGLVSVHTPEFNQNGPTHFIATRRVGPLGGRPGLNALNLVKSTTVTAEQMATLKKIRDSLYEHRSEYSVPVGVPKESADELVMFGNRFKVAPTPGVSAYTMNKDDLDNILENVKNGKQYAHFMMVTIHTHQGDSDMQRAHFGDYPPDFLVSFARATIDNGADAFIGHGPHILRGVEIYKGKPIFYGLGEFVHDLYGTQVPFPARPNMTNAEAAVRQWDTFGGGFGLQHPVNLQAVVAVSRYDKGQLQEVRLYPTEGHAGGAVADVGRPRLAPPDIAKSILERLQKISTPFGTKIAIEGNVGVIRVAGTASSAAR